MLRREEVRRRLLYIRSEVIPRRFILLVCAITVAEGTTTYWPTKLCHENTSSSHVSATCFALYAEEARLALHQHGYTAPLEGRYRYRPAQRQSRNSPQDCGYY